MRFTGRIRFGDVNHADLDVIVEVTDTHVRLVSGDEVLGGWCLADVVANRKVADEFELDLEGDTITFLADDQVNFAYGAVQKMAEGWARYHAMNLLRRKRAVATARRANEPARLDEVRRAFMGAREELQRPAWEVDEPEPIDATELQEPAEADEAAPVIEPVEPGVEADETVGSEAPDPARAGLRSRFWDRVERATAAEEEPVADEERPVVDEPVVVEEPPAAEKELVVEDVPMEVEESPAAEEEPVAADEPVEVEESPAAEEEPVADEERPVMEEPPAADEEHPVVEEPVSGRHSALEETPAPPRPSTVAGRLRRLDALPRRRDDEQEAPAAAVEGETGDRVVPAEGRPAALHEDIAANPEEASSGSETTEAPAQGEAASAEIEIPRGEAETPADEGSGAVEDPLDPSGEPEEGEPIEVERNGHLEAKEPAVLGSYRDGHHPAETTGLRANLRSLFSRGNGAHEHSFVQSTTAGGITRRVCLECGHVSIGVSE